MDDFLGVLVRPVYSQNERLVPVFDNLEAMGANAFCTTPTVSRPAQGGRGKRYPDLHVDGYERVVARPVWGKCELDLETAPAYEPNLDLYQASIYRPGKTEGYTQEDRDIPARMIEEAKKRDMQAYLHIAPFLPPGVQAQDQPVRIDGSVPQAPQVSMSASMNSANAQAYGLALIEDVAKAYPNIDGLSLDWVEYGAYCLEDLFTCFSGESEQQAQTLGFDWERIVNDSQILWEKLHDLTSKDLARGHRLLRRPFELVELLMQYPGWLDLLRFKATTVIQFYAKARQMLDACGLEHITLSARGWPPPWNRFSGLDYRSLSSSCAVMTPKLFTFDYSVMPRWFGQTLCSWNPDLTASEVLDLLVAWMELPDALTHRSFANYHIPAPHEDHPAFLETYRDRVDEVVDQVNGNALVRPFAHAYLPNHQWKRMVALMRDSEVDGMWIQMYGYLSDDKMKIVKDLWRS